MLYRVFASIWIALRMVQRNKLRAGLTVIGITIGIAAVVTMIALGKGARTSVSASVSSLGSNMLLVFPQSGRSSGAKNNASAGRLTELDGEALVRESTSIRLTAPFMRAGAQAIYEGQNTKTSVIGGRLSYFEVRNLKVVKGEKWTTASESVGEKVVLIGNTTAHDLFGTLDPIGRMIRVGKYPYQVIGLLEEKGNSPFGEDQDQIVLMPITTLRTHVLVSARPGDVQGLMLSATSEETTGRALKQSDGDAAAAPPHRRGGRGRLRGAHAGGAAEPARGHLRRALAAAHRHRRDIAPRRGHRRHEHHAGERDGADARDWHSHGHRRPRGRYPDPVPGGGHRARRGGWLVGTLIGYERSRAVGGARVVDDARYGISGAGAGRQLGDRDRVRVLPGAAGGQAGSGGGAGAGVALSGALGRLIWRKSAAPRRSYLTS